MGEAAAEGGPGTLSVEQAGGTGRPRPANDAARSPRALPVTPLSLPARSELPHAAFWADFNDLVVDGLLFVASGFRKPARGARKGGLATMGKTTSDSAPLFAGSSAPSGSGSASGSDDPGSKAVAFGEL